MRRIGRRPSALSREIIPARRLHLIGDDEERLRGAVPTGRDSRLALCLGAAASIGQRLRQLEAPLLEQRLATRDQRMAVDNAFHADPCSVPEALRTSQRGAIGHGCGRDRARDRMLGRVLQRTDQLKRLSTVDAGSEDDVCDRHLPGRDRAGLVEHDRVHPARRLSTSGPLIRMPSCAPGPCQRGELSASPVRARRDRR